jgi:hypothetical protein
VEFAGWKSPAAVDGLFENRPERVDDAGQPEKEAKNYAQNRGFRRTGFQINGQRRQQNGQNDEEDFTHAASLIAGGGAGKMIFQETETGRHRP